MSKLAGCEVICFKFALFKKKEKIDNNNNNKKKKIIKLRSFIGITKDWNMSYEVNIAQL